MALVADRRTRGDELSDQRLGPVGRGVVGDAQLDGAGRLSGGLGDEALQRRGEVVAPPVVSRDADRQPHRCSGSGVASGSISVIGRPKASFG